MHFTTSSLANEEEIWDMILNKLNPEVSKHVSSASSSFYKTEDGIECAVRMSNGDLIACCYSESDRMGGRRWTVDLVE